MNENQKIIINKIWIIADNKVGTYQQSIALAEAIGFEYELIKVNYNYFSKLPNFLLRFFPIHLDKISCKKCYDYIDNCNYFPRFIISSGRRTAPIALWLKKYFILSKIIQIMQPEINYNKFDFIILPKHDKIKNFKFKNLITTIGALNRINDKIIDEEQKKFTSFFDKINKKIVVLLIGGNSKDNSYDPNSIANLCQQVSTIINNNNYFLVALNSPRTTFEIDQIIINNLNCEHVFLEYKNIKNNNPYIASLGYGNLFIATGDSVSMISECCSTGKPVFIFDNNKISSPKHRAFHQQLFQNNYAKNFTINADFNNPCPSKKLQEAKRISSLICNKF